MGEYLFIVSAVLSIANGFVLLYVNPRRAVNQVFCGASVWIAVWALCIAMAIHVGAPLAPLLTERLSFWVKASTIVACYIPWLLWMMQAVICEEKPTIFRTLRSSLPWFSAVTAAALTTASAEFLRQNPETMAGERGIAYVAHLAILFAVSMSIMGISLHQFQRLAGIRRMEMQYLVFGFAIACLGTLLSTAIGRAFGVYYLYRSGPIWVLLLHGIAVWGICNRKVFAAKHIVLLVAQRIGTFFSVSCATLLVLRVLGSNLSYSAAILVASGTGSAIAVAWDKPARKWFKLDVTEKVARARRQVIEWARGVPDEEQLVINFCDLLEDFCQTSAVALLRKQGTEYCDGQHTLSCEWCGLGLVTSSGWVSTESLIRSKAAPGSEECLHFLTANNFGLILAVPRGSSAPSLIVCLGQRESLRPYTYPEIQPSLELVELMDNILTHTRVAAHATRIEKMEAAAMMSRGLAHDLNNLVTPVSTFLLHMESRVPAGSDEAVVLAHAQQSVTAIQEYVRESLFFARRLEPQLQTFDVADLLPAMVELCRDRHPQKRVAIELHSEGCTTLCADRALIQRLVQNLFANALDVAPDHGGIVGISAVGMADNELCLRVVDNGPGVSPHLAERIFEPYFTTKDFGRGRRGLGLGLAICRKIVDLHGGTLTLSANQPHGAMFTVVLPQDRISCRSPLKSETARPKSATTLVPTRATASA